MPELRTDWLTGRTVIVAENRAERPNEFAGAQGEAALAAGHGGAHNRPDAEASTSSQTACPFCFGQESCTPPDVYRSSDASGRWQVRVVPNMFPAVSSEHNLRFAKSQPLSPIQAELIEPAFGAHEVIIESPRHVDRTSALMVDDLREVLFAYAERLRYWRDDGRFRYGLVFKNQGPRAGASMAHLHSQFFALPEVPVAVSDELDRAEQQYRQHQLCAYCHLIAVERAAGERIVLDRDGYVAFCPFASSQPVEVWLLPAVHEPSFEELAESVEFQRLAGVFHALVARLESILPEPTYNMVLRTAPWHVGNREVCHWRIELLPRVSEWAGLELATGVRINPVSPERAAVKLRAIS